MPSLAKPRHAKPRHAKPRHLVYKVYFINLSIKHNLYKYVLLCISMNKDYIPDLKINRVKEIIKQLKIQIKLLEQELKP